MKIFATALLALSLATPSFADETVTVTAPRTPGGAGPSPSLFPGGAGPRNPQPSRPQRIEDGGGSSAPMPQKKTLGGWSLGDKIEGIVSGSITQILSRSISGEATIYVEVETKEGDKVKVWVQVKAASGRGGDN